MGRAPCCEKVGLKRGPWTPDEDEKLVSYINKHGHESWRALPKKAGLLRCGKSCRLRWTNYLRPDIKRGEFSASEEHTIIQLHALLGNRWSAIASHLPKRTDNEIKNYWNTHLKKKLVKMGIDPNTHKLLKEDNILLSSNTDAGTNTSSQPLIASLLLQANHSSNGNSPSASHMAQWESARLEAEARLTRESIMRAKGLWPNPSNNTDSQSVPSLWKSLGGQPFGRFVTQRVGSLEDLKALSAVELMHALQNWEKSLQGQAGLQWPCVWRFCNIRSGVCEGQAESSSCSSPSAGLPTPSAPSATSISHPASRCSPTSTLCTLAGTQEARQEGISSDLLACNRSVKKLSWSDPVVPGKPSPTHSSKLIDGKYEEEGNKGTFSSLMRDIVLGRTGTAKPCVSMEAEVEAMAGGDITTKEGTCKKVNPKDEAVHSIDNVSTASSISEGIASGEMELEEVYSGANEKSRCVNHEEMFSNEMFRDLPKLKREATTMQRVSYTALLSEDISDDWNSLILEEQVRSPTTIHITF